MRVKRQIFEYQEIRRDLEQKKKEYIESKGLQGAQQLKRDRQQDNKDKERGNRLPGQAIRI